MEVQQYPGDYNAKHNDIVNNGVVSFVDARTSHDQVALT
jgi:hypothetical protein